MISASSLPVPFRIEQVGIVVHDLEEAMTRYQARHGWGPWLVYEYAPPRLRETTTRGRPAEFTFLGAEAEIEGGLIVELIQPLDGDSVYREWLDERGEGVHHLGTWARTQEEADALRRAHAELGVGELSSGWIDGVFYVYFETEPVILELWTGDMASVTPVRSFP